MNITDYLVEYLKQGRPVELPGVGALVAKRVEAFYDAPTSTFYPTRTDIEIEATVHNDSEFVQYIADKECVGHATARQIWKNYCDAINDKLSAEGRCVFAGLGTLVHENGISRFEMEHSPDDLS